MAGLFMCQNTYRARDGERVRGMGGHERVRKAQEIEKEKKTRNTIRKWRLNIVRGWWTAWSLKKLFNQKQTICVIFSPSCWCFTLYLFCGIQKGEFLKKIFANMRTRDVKKWCKAPLKAVHTTKPKTTTDEYNAQMVFAIKHYFLNQLILIISLYLQN